MPMTMLKWSNTQLSSLNMINESKIEDFWVFTIEIQYNASNNMLIFNNQIKQITILVRRNPTHEWFEQREIAYWDLAASKKWKDFGDDIIVDGELVVTRTDRRQCRGDAQMRTDRDDAEAMHKRQWRRCADDRDDAEAICRRRRRWCGGDT